MKLRRINLRCSARLGLCRTQIENMQERMENQEERIFWTRGFLFLSLSHRNPPSSIVLFLFFPLLPPPQPSLPLLKLVSFVQGFIVEEGRLILHFLSYSEDELCTIVPLHLYILHSSLGARIRPQCYVGGACMLGLFWVQCRLLFDCKGWDHLDFCI